MQSDKLIISRILSDDNKRDSKRIHIAHERDKEMISNLLPVLSSIFNAYNLIIQLDEETTTTGQGNTMRKQLAHDQIAADLETMNITLKFSNSFPTQLLLEHIVSQIMLEYIKNDFPLNFKIISWNIIGFHYCRNESAILYLLQNDIINILLQNISMQLDNSLFIPVLYSISNLAPFTPDSHVFIEQNSISNIKNNVLALESNSDQNDIEINNSPVHRVISKFVANFTKYFNESMNLQELIQEFVPLLLDNIMETDLDLIKALGFIKSIEIIQNCNIFQLLMQIMSQSNIGTIYLECIRTIRQLISNFDLLKFKLNEEFFSSISKITQFDINIMESVLGNIGQFILIDQNICSNFLRSSLFDIIIDLATKNESTAGLQAILILIFCTFIDDSLINRISFEIGVISMLDVFISIDNEYIQNVILEFLILSLKFSENANILNEYDSMTNEYIRDLIDMYMSYDNEIIIQKATELEKLYNSHFNE